MEGEVRLFGCGVWGFILYVLEGVGDGRSGTLVQDDYGTYADASGPP